MNGQATDTSMECDLECLSAVLRVFGRAFEAGPGEPEIEKLIRAGEQLDSGKQCRSCFTVQTGGARCSSSV